MQKYQDLEGPIGELYHTAAQSFPFMVGALGYNSRDRFPLRIALAIPGLIGNGQAVALL